MNEIALAPCLPSNLIVTVESAGNRGMATVWSIESRCKVACFFVDWDIGGQRTAVTADSPVRVVTAAYYVQGLSGYDLQGKRVWHRRDLKRIQDVSPFRGEDGHEYIAVGLERGPLTIVSAGTAETKLEIPRVSRAFFGDVGVALRVEAGALLLLIGNPPHCRRLPLHSFAVLDAAFSTESVAYSEASGALRCFSFAGERLWEVDFGEGSHALEVAWNGEHGVWLAVVWDFKTGGPRWLHRIDSTGQRVSMEGLGCCDVHRLARSGDCLVLNDGRVLDPIRSEVRWVLGSA